MKTSKECIRLVGLSAPLPNYEDVASFLRVDLDKGLFCFDNSYRPCPLAQKYVRVTVRNPLQRLQLMNDLCYEKVVAVAGKQQVLIFVHSMNETIQMARKIRDIACSNGDLGHFLKEGSASHKVLNHLAHLVRSIDLKDILPYGFAFHHTGMTTKDCIIVEDLFCNGHVQVLVTTTNFAWGVNFPAHTVIIKGTDTYNPDNGSWTELSPLDVMQMVGCARKPQHDSYAEVIILTDVSKRLYYMEFINGKIPIESQFVSKLPYQLNLEIALGTVQNVKEACDWIAYTYLYVRMSRNPTLYGLAPKNPSKEVELRERVADLIQLSVTILERSNLLKYDKSSGNFQVTE
ncbi:Dexh-box atp-dependent rna helicase dexh12 [Thalictrum thalictroides]|uniref:Dexh-box atp-dependent rna helicase dexh12 n=1 Tax=Thalictrum thalictroides TaxID=46969 RepID=A0A7J6WJ42_THATH|nr:Dexh-box atp-dependent rna helicase dexh12 [Thalictrum thalictroides]